MPRKWPDAVSYSCLSTPFLRSQEGDETVKGNSHRDNNSVLFLSCPTALFTCPSVYLFTLSLFFCLYNYLSIHLVFHQCTYPFIHLFLRITFVHLSLIIYLLFTHLSICIHPSVSLFICVSLFVHPSAYLRRQFTVQLTHLIILLGSEEDGVHHFCPGPVMVLARYCDAWHTCASPTFISSADTKLSHRIIVWPYPQQCNALVTRWDGLIGNN